MRICKQYINQNNSLAAIVITVLFVAGCGGKTPQSGYVARVNSAYLTYDDLKAMTDSSLNADKLRKELIRNWIDKELLYQKAIDEGILEDEQFNRIISDSKKELAGTMLLNKYFEKAEVIYKPSDIEKYYKENKSNFLLFSDAYLLNYIEFDNKDDAIKFRSTVLTSDWNKALHVFKGNPAIARSIFNGFYYSRDIYPISLRRYVKELYPNEISIVFKNESDNFALVQLVTQYKKGGVPPFYVVKSSVKKQFLADRRSNILRDLLKELQSSSEIEIKY